MSSAAARPGVIRGPYPERRDERAPALSRVLRWGVGLLSVPRRARHAQVEAFAREVDAAAAGVADLDDAALDARVDALRGELQRRGIHDPLLPRAFALVREAARRSIGKSHYDVQLYGGRVMARQGLAELETGEGKTLTATLTASVAALAGIPVHVITANDYLVARDAESMRPVYARLGLSTGTVVDGEHDPRARREAYGCDITYVTNNQVAFDYLRDRTGDHAEPVLRGLCFALVDEADSVLIDDARTPLILSRPGAPPDASLIHDALALARALEADRDYRVDWRRGTLEVTPAGLRQLEALAEPLEGPLAGPLRREEWVQRALSALHLYERDRNYLVHEKAVQVIDLPTGRRAPDRAFEGGMHSLIEAKEGLDLSPQRETAARISYQSFFRRYLRLGGMTGTVREVAREMWGVYRLRTVRVPTRLPSQRRALGLRVYASAEARWDAAVERIRALHGSGRPVLVGTASVGASEELGERLVAAGLPCQVLNARQDGDEARLIARAGEAGRITVATRMAGRGTDIALGPGVSEAGGLAVLATELGDAGRIDRQLFGRCARQGEPGSYEQLVSLEDTVLRARLPEWLRRMCSRMALLARIGGVLTRYAQRAEQRRSTLARQQLLEYERHLERLLAFTGDR